MKDLGKYFSIYYSAKYNNFVLYGVNEWNQLFIESSDIIFPISERKVKEGMCELLKDQYELIGYL